MTKDEFIAKAKELGYDAEGIKDLLATYDDLKAHYPDFKYEDFVLIPQAVY